MLENRSRNLKRLSDAVTERHRNFVVSEVNDACLRLAVNEGAYEWHRHPNSEELFIVLEGELHIEFADEGPVKLVPGDIFKIPIGKIHRTTATGRTVNLCFELTDAQTEFVPAPKTQL